MYHFLTSIRFMFLWMIGLCLSAIGALIGVSVLLPVLTRLVVSLPFMPAAGTAQTVVYMALFAIGSGIPLGLLIGSVQKSLVRQKFHVEFRWWLFVSVLGAIFGVIVSEFVALTMADQLGSYIDQLRQFNNVRPPDVRALAIYIVLLYSPPIVMMSILQTLVLRLYTRASWLWVLAHIVSAILFSTLLYTLILTGGLFIFVGWLGALLLVLSPGIITGFTLLFLMTLIRKPWWPEEI